GYAALRRIALNDAALARNLQPIVDFMAFRHPVPVPTAVPVPAKPPKRERRAQAKLRKSVQHVQRQAARGQFTLDSANAVLGETAASVPTPAAPAAPPSTAASTSPAASSSATGGSGTTR